MSKDDLEKYGIKPADRSADDAASPQDAPPSPVDNRIGRFLQRTTQVCAFASLGVGVTLMFAELQPAGLAIIFAAVAVLLAEFEDVVCGSPDQRTR